MAVLAKYGFYDAELVNDQPDRTYSASDMNSQFIGLITDGVFSTYGTCFAVTKGPSNYEESDGTNTTTYESSVYVGTGKAWFNNTWTLLSVDEGDEEHAGILGIDRVNMGNNRHDFVCLQVDTNSTERKNSIVILKGSPDTDPSVADRDAYPGRHWYPLARVIVPYSSSPITSDDLTIENLVGVHGKTPYVTGAMQQMSIESIVSARAYDWELSDIILYQNSWTNGTGAYEGYKVYTVSDQAITSTSIQEVLFPKFTSDFLNPSGLTYKQNIAQLQLADIVDGDQSTGSLKLISLNQDWIPGSDLNITILFKKYR